MDPIPPTPDPLDRLLDRWSDTPDPSSDLRRVVWRRIALVESHAPPRSFWLVEQLNRPFFATVFVFGCVVTGLFLAEVRVARLQSEASSRLARSYLQLIDPLLRNQGQGTKARK